MEFERGKGVKQERSTLQHFVAAHIGLLLLFPCCSKNSWKFSSNLPNVQFSLAGCLSRSFLLTGEMPQILCIVVPVMCLMVMLFTPPSQNCRLPTIHQKKIILRDARPTLPFSPPGTTIVHFKSWQVMTQLYGSSASWSLLFVLRIW